MLRTLYGRHRRLGGEVDNDRRAPARTGSRQQPGRPAPLKASRPACRPPARRRSVKLRDDIVPGLAALENAARRTGIADAFFGAPRSILAVGASDRSGWCPSRVWMTSRPAVRAVVPTLIANAFFLPTTCYPSRRTNCSRLRWTSLRHQRPRARPNSGTLQCSRQFCTPTTAPTTPSRHSPSRSTSPNKAARGCTWFQLKSCPICPNPLRRFARKRALPHVDSVRSSNARKPWPMRERSSWTATWLRDIRCATFIELALALKADLLVIGATGHSAFYERMIGSRADRLIQLAPCPVLVIKLGASGARPHA